MSSLPADVNMAYVDDQGQVAVSNHVTNHPARLQAPAWDPAALLNPKGFNSKPAAPRHDRFSAPAASSSNGISNNVNHSAQPAQVVFQFTSGGDPTVLASPSPAPVDLVPADPNANSDGMGHMIESMNNVQDRSTVPVPKRRKVDNGSDLGKSNGFNGGSSGMLADHIRLEEKKAQLKDKTNGGQTLATLDLTGDEDSLPQVRDAQDEEVCFGMVYPAQVNCHIVPSPKPGTQTFTPGSWPQVKVVLRRIDGDKTDTIEVYDHTRTTIGKLGEKTAHVLAPLLDSRALNLRTDAFIGTRRSLPDEVAGKPISRSYGLQLMVYGKVRFARTVAKYFMKGGLNLLSPTRVDRGIRVCNPLAQENRPSAVLPKASDTTAQYSQAARPQVSRSEGEIRSDVLNVFDSLADNDQIPEAEPDDRVVTPLLKHQKQALHFMKGREDASGPMDPIWKRTVDGRSQVVFYHVVTKQATHQPPKKPLGGILADMMGLGKTLSILSLIASTLPDSLEWDARQPVQPVAPNQNRKKNVNAFEPPKAASLQLTPVKRNSKATLLVCPLSTIANWEEQIKQHIKPGSLTYHIYHGPHRIKDFRELVKFDLVITTYGSVSSELNSRSANKPGFHPLEEIGWFRVVLDEAHMIREQSTLQFKAICRLQANRRWAVTGTPVQNKLDDLGSLLAFLRVRPFHDRNMFNAHIIQPFKACDESIIPKLRLLVDTITLRRMKDKIDLPMRHDETVKLQMSAPERRMYDIFQKDAELRVKVIAGQHERMVGGRSYIHILQAILRLRLFCSAGPNLLKDDDLRLLEGSSSDVPIDIDSDDDDDNKPALTESRAYELFNLMQDTNGDTCITCNQKLGAKEGGEIESERQEEVMGYMTPCLHLLCTSCIKTYQGLCACGDLINNTVALRISKATEEHEPQGRDNGNATVKGFQPLAAPYTKMAYLISELKMWKEKSMANPDEPPYKSVVFSQWTTNLDLIQAALVHAGITLTRLDGKMTRLARTRAMDSFREDANIQVILVSITAGGLGLNLTTGNSVYIMEPLFNPAAEAQAVDRVHRLGQKREVYCKRLIMEDSFEEKMRLLQEKKMKLASISMDRDKGEAGRFQTRKEAAKQRLLDLRTLFSKGGKL